MTESNAQWFKDIRFGVFVHWGLYAIPAKGEWMMLLERWSPEEYTSAFLPQFNPKKSAVQEWVAAAKDAGAEYMVFTTRHHDGFCLFDSKASIGDFTSMNSPARRDFVAEYAQAVREAGMKVGFYYSLADWRVKSHSAGQPVPEAQARLQKQAMEQVRELMTNYGQVDILWYDGAFGYDEKGICWGTMGADWKAAEMNAMARELQPGIAINDRSGVPEDFSTPEQHITAPTESGRAWESCMTMNDNWGFHRWDDNWKPTKQLIGNLTQCSSGGGSYLLNIGPTADGSVPEPALERLSEMGKWMRVHGHTLHGESVPLLIKGWPFPALKKDGVLYIHVRNWFGGELRFGYCPVAVKEAYMLKSGTRVEFKQQDDFVSLSGLPDAPEDAYDTVIALRVE